MDIITTALMAGIAQTGKKAIDDAYNGMKTIIRNKFGNSNLAKAIDDLESNPDSKGRQITVQEEVESAQADRDNEIIEAAQKLLKMTHSQQTSGNIFLQNAQGSKGAIQAVNINTVIQKGE